MAFLPVRTYLCPNRFTGSAVSRAGPAGRSGRMMEAFIFMRNYPYDPSCPEIPPTGTNSGGRAETVHGSPSLTEEAARNAMRKTADELRRQTDPAGLAVPYAGAESDAVRSGADTGVSARADHDSPAVYAKAPSADRAGYHTQSRGVESSFGGRQNAMSANTPSAQASRPKKKKKKRKRKPFSFVDVLKYIFPWRGDSWLEAARKLIFVAAMSVFSVCLYLIGDYYLGLYRDRKAYQSIQHIFDETRRNQHSGEEQPVLISGEDWSTEHLEYNEIAEKLLSQNSDLVGYITIENTPVSYPVVQRKSTDPNFNTNDYYLHRNFYEKSSDAGCIFMDFRCVFDDVFDHIRVAPNSENLLIYGHNMLDESMFGSLRNYMRDYSYYSKHPIVQLSSLYKTYTYKIFAVFVVDGGDLTSPYAFDCWNTLNFTDEDDFYEYVNMAKKRNIISNDVDVTYGDQLLTLYTCNTLIDNGKLILMCRQVRPGEDPKEGTENGRLNDNILYPKAYYRYRKETFDPSKFVPYGPSNS